MPIIQFHEDGTTDFTRNPILENLFNGEEKRVDRMTEILFDVLAQKYYIQFKTGDFEGIVLRWADCGLDRAAVLSAWWHRFTYANKALLAEVCCLMRHEGIVYFRSYEDAVRVEVEFVDYLRTQNIRML